MKRSMIKKEICQQQQTKTNMSTLTIQVEGEIEHNMDRCESILSIQYNSQEVKK